MILNIKVVNGIPDNELEREFCLWNIFGKDFGI